MQRTARNLFAVGVIATGLALVLIARGGAYTSSISDTAVIESDTLLATRGQVLLGLYSRFQWHHPGPFSFFWMAPFYAFSGFRTAGLSAGALALNLVAVGLVAWVIARRSSVLPAVSICAAIALYLFRAAEMIASPWVPHLLVLPMMSLLVVAADAMSGTTWMLLLVTGLASVVAQAHVGVLPAAALIAGITVVYVTWRASRDKGGLALLTPALIASAASLLVLWTPPLLDQLFGRPGNLTLLWRFFVSESRPGQSLDVARAAWSDMLSGLVRPDFYVAHGWSFRESRFKWSEALAIIQLVALIVYGIRASMSRRRFELSLTVVLLVASLIGLWSTTRIEGDIIDHSVFWLSAVGTLNMAILVALLADLVPAAGRVAPTIPGLPRAFSWVPVVVIMLVGVQQLREAVRQSKNPGAEADAASAIAGDVHRFLNEREVDRPLIKIDQDVWGVAAGVILRLQKAQVPLAVEDDWLVMFTPAFAATGRESTVITVAGRIQHVRLLGSPGDTVISSHDPFYAHVSRGATAGSASAVGKTATAQQIALMMKK